jgi:transposase
LGKEIFTEESMKRLKALEEVLKGEISLIDASKILKLSYRHTLRLKKRYKQEGLDALRFKKRGRKKKITEQEQKFIAYLYFQTYEGRLNIMHFKEKIEEEHGIRYSYESIRKILLSTGLKKAKKRKIKYRHRRRRMPKEGMLVQMDSSYHQWLENIPEKWYLIAMIDDASGKVYYARFYNKDTTFNNMEVIKNWIKRKGLFMALYVDKASHFHTTRKHGIHYDISDEFEDTQIERALEELGITLITANSPQAKGRIERLFKTFQDRLINELYFNNITDYEQANKFLLKHFLPYYNKRFALKRIRSLYSPVPSNLNLDLIFAKRYFRTVRNDFTISFMREIIQLPPSKHKLSLRKAQLELRLTSDFSLFIFYKNNLIHSLKLPETNKLIQKEILVDNLLKSRGYFHD